MRVIISIITIFALVATIGITISEAGESSRLFYTAHNIWRMRWFNMKCINYKHGSDILPAGTMVKNVGAGYDRQIKNLISLLKRLMKIVSTKYLSTKCGIRKNRLKITYT